MEAAGSGDLHSVPRVELRQAAGLAWVPDGLLQAQPGCRPASVGNPGPEAAGQPGQLATFLPWEVGARQAHPVHLTVAAVLIQIGNGAAILSGGDSWVGSLGLRA
ncbi:MAG: hypothetical protein ACYDCB_04150 [Candidatus Dormibacteria bacterium]